MTDALKKTAKDIAYARVRRTVDKRDDMKMILKIAGIVLAAVVLAAIIYIAYVFIAYHRLDDALPLEAQGPAEAIADTEVVYTITTFNIGFGAYSTDYSFFMDGGEHAWAMSRDDAIKNVNGAVGIIAEINPDFAFFQEVDTDSTRSYHVDELGLLTDMFPEHSSVFALNYNSPFLMYPLSQPIGKSVSGIVTLSGFAVTDALRRSLPIESGFRKLLDLDRCYSITRVPVSNTAELVLINLHLSAYTEDETIGKQQLKILFEDAEREYNAGNYVIIGGDFNKDLLGDSVELFGTKTDVPNWAKPIDMTLVPAGFTVLRPENESDICPTVRDCDTGYVEGVTFVSAIDGFIVSDNITPVHEEYIDAGFTYTDHNPVLLQFTLNTTATGGACGKYGCPLD